MKMSSKKKAFTLVELLVVIAILAVLASVSIVGYLNFTEKAKESNDQSLVKQLNTVLQASAALEDSNETYADAIEDAEEAGFSVEKMTPTSTKSDILWDQDSDRFVLVKNGKVTFKDDKSNVNLSKPYKLWKIVDEYDEELTYSQYITDKNYGLGPLYEINNIDTGIDLGKNIAKFNLNYNGNIQDDFIIRTNGTSSSVNVTTNSSNIHHYGYAGEINVNKVPTECYHEFGNTAFISLTDGKLIVEPEAVVRVINVKSTNAIVSSKATEVEPSVLCDTEEIKQSVATNGYNKETKVSTVEELESAKANALAETSKQENNNKPEVCITDNHNNKQYVSFMDFVNQVNDTDGPAHNDPCSDFTNYTVELQHDVYLDPNKPFFPIGYGSNINGFEGKFDGHGYTIYNATIQRRQYDGTGAPKYSRGIGLFATVIGQHVDTITRDNYQNITEDKYGTRAVIKNFNMVNETVEMVSERNSFIAGYASNAYISNVHVYNSKFVDGNEYLKGRTSIYTGGIIAVTGGNCVVKDCSLDKDVNISSESAIGHAGGIIGCVIGNVSLINNECSAHFENVHSGLAGMIAVMPCEYKGVKNNAYLKNNRNTKDMSISNINYGSTFVGGMIGVVNNNCNIELNGCENNATLEIKNTDKKTIVSLGALVGTLMTSGDPTVRHTFINCKNNVVLVVNDKILNKINAKHDNIVGFLVGQYGDDKEHQQTSNIDVENSNCTNIDKNIKAIGSNADYVLK